MRRFSKKRSELLRNVTPLRDEYRLVFSECQWCGSEAAELHEIARGKSRERALSERAAWLHLCWECHRIMEWLPIVAQLAIKRVADYEGYNRRKVNELRDRHPDAITEDEVMKWVRRLSLGVRI